MRIFLAEEVAGKPILDILGGPVGTFQKTPADLSLETTTSSESAEMILCPHDAKYIKGNKDYFKYLKSLARNKHILIFNRGDFPLAFDSRQIISLQNSIRPGANSSGVVLIPYNVQTFSHLPFRDYSKTPTISFVGYVPRVSPGRIVRSFSTRPLHPLQNNSALIRKMAILAASKNQNHLIRVRRKYGAVINSDEDIFKNRSEFEQILLQSDFVLCPRGDANQSQRFYEALSAGRIPVIPDSQIAYPHVNDYPLFAPGITTRTLCADLQNKLSSTWNDLNSKSYLQLQQGIRKTFSNLEYEGYIRNLFSGSTENLLSHLNRNWPRI